MLLSGRLFLKMILKAIKGLKIQIIKCIKVALGVALKVALKMALKMALKVALKNFQIKFMVK